jgi:uncharacterized coiled-coil protein SlyX
MDEDRIRRIEEAILFAEQRADGLDQAVRELLGRLGEVADRLGSLQQRLDDLHARAESDADEDDGTTPPPHAGRLPGGR